MVERAKNMFHLSNQTGNESRSASRSNGGGDPYGLNAFGGVATACGTATTAWAMITVAICFNNDQSMKCTGGNTLVLRRSSIIRDES